MERTIKNILETLICIRNFQGTTGLPVNPLATTLFTQVTAVATELEGYGCDQVLGRGICAGGTDDRQRIAGELLAKIRPVSRTTKRLDKDLFPGVAAQFRMPRSSGYQALLATARAMMENLGPVKAALVARGLPADFDEEIQAAIVALETATGRKFSGLATQAGGTSGLADAARRGRKHVRDLDAIMRNLLRTNPSLLGAWLTASHVQCEPGREGGETPAAPSPAPAPTAPPPGP